MPTIREISSLRQQAAQYAGEWRVQGTELFNDIGEPVAKCKTSSYATYLAGIHNTWLLLANAWLMITRTLKDRRAMNIIAAKERK